MRAIRMAGLLGAVIVCAWFALGVRQAHEIDQATNIITASHRTPAQLRSALGDLHDAAFLNPDRTIDVLRGRVAIEQGDLRRARRILAAATSAEPENLEAWLWYTGASLGLPGGSRGFAHLVALDPIDAHDLRH